MQDLNCVFSFLYDSTCWIYFCMSGCSEIFVKAYTFASRVIYMGKVLLYKYIYANTYTTRRYNIFQLVIDIWWNFYELVAIDLILISSGNCGVRLVCLVRTHGWLYTRMSLRKYTTVTIWLSTFLLSATYTPNKYFLLFFFSLLAFD